MPVYAKKVSTDNPRFSGRQTVIMSIGAGIPGRPATVEKTAIDIPDNVVLCNGCNANIAETEDKEGYLVYLGKRELDKDQPYDFYCERCLKEYFKGYKEVS